MDTFYVLMLFLIVYSPVSYVFYYSSFLQRTLVLFKVTLRVWYTLSLIVCLWAHIPPLSLLLTMDISFPFLAQILSLLLLQDPTSFLLIFSCLLSSQRYGFTCKTLEKPISWLLSNFAASSSLSQIFYFSITFFTFLFFVFLSFIHLPLTFYLFFLSLLLFFPPWFSLFWSLSLFTFFRTPCYLYIFCQDNRKWT